MSKSATSLSTILPSVAAQAMDNAHDLIVDLSGFRSRCLIEELAHLPEIAILWLVVGFLLEGICNSLWEAVAEGGLHSTSPINPARRARGSNVDGLTVDDVDFHAWNFLTVYAKRDLLTIDVAGRGPWCRYVRSDLICNHWCVDALL